MSDTCQETDSQNQWERVEEDDPRRCQAVIATRGQCLNARMEGSEYCPAHGGNRARATLKKQKTRMYQVERFQQKLNAMEDHEGLKSLHSEIAVLRMILEARLKSCTDDHSLLLYSQPLSDLAVKLEKLVTSCNRLDQQLGSMLDTTQALQWMTMIVDIIGQHIQDEVVLDEIAAEILDSFEKVKHGNV